MEIKEVENVMDALVDYVVLSVNTIDCRQKPKGVILREISQRLNVIATKEIRNG